MLFSGLILIIFGFLYGLLQILPLGHIPASIMASLVQIFSILGDSAHLIPWNVVWGSVITVMVPVEVALFAVQAALAFWFAAKP